MLGDHLTLSSLWLSWPKSFCSCVSYLCALRQRAFCPVCLSVNLDREETGVFQHRKAPPLGRGLKLLLHRKKPCRRSSEYIYKLLKCLLLIYHHTHRPERLSTAIREASHSRWQLTETTSTPKLVNVQRIVEFSVLNEMFISCPLASASGIFKEEDVERC